MSVKKRLGELLVEAGLISAAELDGALEQQRRLGGHIGRILIDAQLVTEAGLVTFLARQLQLRVATFPEEPPAVLSIIPVQVAERYRVFPLAKRTEERGDLLALAMADPTNIDVIDSLQFRLSCRIVPLIASETAIETAIRRHYHGEKPRDVPAQGPPQFAGTEVELPEGPEEIPLVTGV